MFRESRLIGVTLASVNAARQKAGASTVAPVGQPLNTRQLDKQVQFQDQQRANNLSGVGSPKAVDGGRGQGEPVYFGATPDNPTGTGEIAYYKGGSQATPYKFEGIPGAGTGAQNQYAQTPRDPRNPTGAAPPKGAKVGNDRNMGGVTTKPGAKGGTSTGVTTTPEGTSTSGASTPGASTPGAAGEKTGTGMSGREAKPYGGRTSEEGKSANAAAATNTLALKKMAGNNVAGTAAMSSFLSTLTPEQQQLLAPISFGMSSMNEEFKNIAAQSLDDKNTAMTLADESANNQKKVLDMTAKAIEDNKQETADFLTSQMDAMNKNLLAQKENTKAWLDMEKQSETRRLQREKAQTVANMAFAAAVTGGTFSSSANAAISAAEADADRQISEMHAQYGLKSADIDMAYTAAYTELNGKYMQGMLSALQDFRKDSLENLGKQFANEDARKKSKLDASQRYTDTLNQLTMTKASAITQAMNNVSSILVADKAAQTAQAQWKSEYNYRTDKDNRDFAFQQDTFQKNYALQAGQLQQQGKQLELADWQAQFAARTTVATQARDEIQRDRSVSAYETTYRPAWDAFSAAFDSPEGSAGRDTAISSAFTQLLRTSNSADSANASGVLSTMGLGSVDDVIKSFQGSNLTPEQTEQMYDIASSIYSKAQDRRNDAVTKVMAGVQKTNLQFTDDFFKIKPEDVGIQTTPLSQEAVQIIDTLPPETKSKISKWRLGNKDITTSYEMQLRLQEADRMFFADTGQHIQVTSNYRPTSVQADLYAKSQRGEIGRAAPPGSSEHEFGRAVDISPAQWQIAQPYLVKAGLMQLPASIDQEDPGHFSLTGR